MTDELKVEKALWLYNNGDEVKGFDDLLSLSTSGVPLAQYHAGLICQKNQILFLAGDIWQDLLDHEVKPRKPVVELLYEIYSWTGDLGSTEQLINEEKLKSLRQDLDSRNFVSNREKTTSMAGGYLVAERKAIQALSSSWSYKQALNLLESKANLAVLASQIAYSGEPFMGGQSVLISGSDIWSESLEERLNDAVGSWKDVRVTSVEVLMKLSEKGKDNSPEMAKVATIGLEAQERLFFFNGSMTVEDSDTKIHVNNIAYGLQWSNKIASHLYLALAK